MKLSEWAANAGWKVACVEAEVASGMTGKRPRLRRLLADRRCRPWRRPTGTG
jgi:putative resolvase